MPTRFPKFPVPTILRAPNRATDRRFNAITLFSGMGSDSLALRNLGYNVLCHDFMPEAVASLNANGFDAIQGDVRDIDFTATIYRGVRVVAGGPPCQPFSQGGRNAGENDERDMIPDFQRAVAQIMPEVFLLENVRGLASPRHAPYLDRRVEEFEAMGYMVGWRVLNAADYGVSQDRKRLIMIGVRLDLGRKEVRWPERTRPVSMADFLGWDRDTAKARNALAPNPGPPGSFEWVFERPSTTVVGSFRPEVQAAPGYRRAGDGPRQNAPGSVVTTIPERLLLQGMPRNWKVLGCRSKIDLQIGNSIPNPMLKAVLEQNLIR